MWPAVFTPVCRDFKTACCTEQYRPVEGRGAPAKQQL